MRLWLFIGLMLLCGLGFAQPGKSGASVPDRIDAYLKTAGDSLLTNLPVALQASQNALQLARDNALPQLEQRCYLALVRIYQTNGQADLAVRSYDRAIALNLPNSTQLQYQKLPLLEQISDPNKALRDARSIRDLARSQGNREMESKALIVVGNVLSNMGDFEASLAALKEAEALTIPTDLRQQAYVQNYIGDNYNNLRQEKKAEKAYQNSIDIGKNTGDRKLMTSSFDRLNNLYRQQKRSGDLIELNNRVVEQEEKIKSPPNLQPIASREVGQDSFWVEAVAQNANLNLATAYLETEASTKAIDILEKLDNEVPNEDLEQTREVKKLLSQAYDQSGQYAEALESYKAFVAVQDSLLKEKDLRIREAMKKNLALQALENQVVVLEKDRDLRKKEMELGASDLRLQRTIMLAIVLVSLVSLGFLVVVIRKNRAKTRANHLLELKSLRTRMNPHFIFNSLNSVNHFIAKSDEKAANKYLSRFARLMREVLESSDKDFISLEKELELLEVYLALEHQRFENKFEYHLEVDPAVRAEDYRVPPMLVQPFVENAIWHGLRYTENPGILAVRFQQKGPHLLIEVEDNGIGRAASKNLKTKSQNQHQSTGIRNSQNRVDLFNQVYGGSIDIQIVDKTTPQTGTLVRIQIANQDGN